MRVLLSCLPLRLPLLNPIPAPARPPGRRAIGASISIPAKIRTRFELRAEFRSPVKRKTYLLHAFRDGDRRFTIRFAPTEEGDWDYRLTSNVARLEGQIGKINAAGSASPGFVKTANLHHFATADGKPHLWMADRARQLSGSSARGVRSARWPRPPPDKYTPTFA